MHIKLYEDWKLLNETTDKENLLMLMKFLDKVGYKYDKNVFKLKANTIRKEFLKVDTSLRPTLLKYIEKLERLNDFDFSINRNICMFGLSNINLPNRSYTFKEKPDHFEDLPETFFHEFGHALQFYFSGDYNIHELRKTSRELLEIPSISLELFSQEVFHVFYGDRAEERKILHIINLLTLICKTCILDDWQRIIYRNPNMNQEERNQFWEDAEREFTPWRTPNPERWKQDYTIFESPFYDLDYGIATICSFQLWMEYNSDKKSAIKKYLKLCSLGGKKDFQETLKHAKLENPFNRKTFKKITQMLNEFLEQY